MVERSLSMREARGSIPRLATLFCRKKREGEKHRVGLIFDFLQHHDWTHISRVMGLSVRSTAWRKRKSSEPTLSAQAVSTDIGM